MQTGLGREVSLQGAHLTMWAVGYGTVREIYGNPAAPDAEWRATVMPTTGGMVERCLVLGTKKPNIHMVNRPSYVIYGYFNGNYRDAWCSVVPQASISAQSELRSENTYFDQIGKVLWRTDNEGNLYLEDWVTVDPPPLPPLPPAGTVRPPDPPGTPDFPAPAPVPGPVPGGRNVIIKVSPLLQTVDFWEAATLTAVPAALVRFFGGGSRMAREGDTTISNITTDAAFWGWLANAQNEITLMKMLNSGIETDALIIDTILKVIFQDVPTSLAGVINSGSDRILGDTVGP